MSSISGILGIFAQLFTLFYLSWLSESRCFPFPGFLLGRKFGGFYILVGGIFSILVGGSFSYKHVRVVFISFGGWVVLYSCSCGFHKNICVWCWC